MRQNMGFSLQWINEIPYLLPFGQKIADHKRGVRINETGAFIWNTLSDSHSREELCEAVFAHYAIPDDQRGEASRDLSDFLTHLLSLGMIDPEEASDADAAAVSMNLQIGGLLLVLCGPAAAFSPEFLPFSHIPEKPADCTVFVHADETETPEIGRLLLQSRDLFVFSGSAGYRFLFPAADGILEADLSEDGSTAHFYVRPPFTGSLREELFHAIRLVFLYLAQLRGRFAMHSASILYGGKAWLFSGHSGMGKSTHTNLWKEHCQTPVLNGDLNLLELGSDGPLVHGLPWCGTSGISTTKTYPLGGIVLLGQAASDQVELLTDDEKTLLVSQRLISPSWTADQLAENLSFTAALTAQIPVCRFKCTKSYTAVETIREWIDRQSG